jgi:hypothetical protein
MGPSKASEVRQELCAATNKTATGFTDEEDPRLARAETEGGRGQGG